MTRRVRSTVLARCAKLASATALAVALASCSAAGDEVEHVDDPPTRAPSEDYASNMVACMTEKGWDVEENWEGGFDSPRGGLLPGQVQQFNSDTDECESRFGYDLPAPPLTQEEVEQLYDVLTGPVTECVEALGYSVPDPPSRQAYVEHLIGGGLADWHPYYVTDESMAAYEKIRRNCPVP
jgi:hypothetical protein